MEDYAHPINYRCQSKAQWQAWVISPLTVDQKCPIHIKMIQARAIALVYPLELNCQILLLKTPYTWVTGHGEIK